MKDRVWQMAEWWGRCQVYKGGLGCKPGISPSSPAPLEDLITDPLFSQSLSLSCQHRPSCHSGCPLIPPAPPCLAHIFTLLAVPSACALSLCPQPVSATPRQLQVRTTASAGLPVSCFLLVRRVSCGCQKVLTKLHGYIALSPFWVSVLSEPK